MEYRLDGKTKKAYKFLRDDIEKIIKEEKIDRSRFQEFSKIKFHGIIKKFYYAFSDYEHFSSATVTLTRKRLHIRCDIESNVIAGMYVAGSWNWAEYLKAIKSACVLNANQKLFLILSEGWVYEGYVDEIFKVLNKIDSHIEFFILSKKFDWFIVHDYIDECAFMYYKKERI